jgi:hypothetical protein
MFIVWELSYIMLNITNPTPPTTHIPLGLSNVYCVGIVIDYVKHHQTLSAGRLTTVSMVYLKFTIFINKIHNTGPI